MSIIGDIFDDVVIDNLNDAIDDISTNMRRRHYEHNGLSDEEKVWAAQQFAQTWGQAYCNNIYADAKHLNDNDNYDNVLDVRLNDEGGGACYFIRSQMTGDKWQSRAVMGYGSNAMAFCQDLFEVSAGRQAAELSVDLTTALLVRAFEDYGFYVDVFTESEYSGSDEKWIMRLSWEDGTPQDEPEVEAE